MDDLGVNFPDMITNVCLAKFATLGRTGKPKDDGEYTLMACVVKRDVRGTLEVVALGTGSKCIGRSHLPSKGDVLHDSHAEVIARRAFLHYLISQIENAVSDETSIFQVKENGKFGIVPGITFHFYISHTPCGDASIFPKQEWSQDTFGDQVNIYKEPSLPVGVEPPVKKLKLSEDECSINLMQHSVHISKHEDESESLHGNLLSNDFENESAKSDANYHKNEENGNQQTTKTLDIHRTGAKCALGEEEDPKMVGVNYHVTSVLRTKPGRGDPTLSMSCSDKIFKWSVLGLQGALIMLLLEAPVYLETITVGNCPYSHEAMDRAFLGRFKDKLRHINLPSGFRVVTPLFYHSSLDFQYSRSVVTENCANVDKTKPSPSSLIWSLTDAHSQKHEVSINGIKLGTTKKNLGTPKSWVSICRQVYFQKVVQLINTIDNKEIGDKTYAECKQMAVSYQEAWSILKKHVLCNWTCKPLFTKDFKIFKKVSFSEQKNII